LQTRGTVFDYFQNAFRRLPQRTESPVPLGPLILGPGRLCAAFHVPHAAGRLERVAYRCTSCATLVALCEHLSELASGRTFAEARCLDASALLALHPEIPAGRRDRSALAVAAFRAALPLEIEGEPI
jgi:hypothetical protein